jgi:AcrR family transcriptional regulator
MAGRERAVVVVPTGRHGLPANVVADHQRQRLIMATIELVGERGYQATSIDQIAKAAKVGYVAFYELFAGKEELFMAAFEQIIGEARELLGEAVDAEAPWPEQICAVVVALLEAGSENPARARLALVETLAAGAAVAACYEAALASAIPKLREGRELAGGELAPSREEGILAGLSWIAHRLLVNGEAERLGELGGEAIELVLSPYLGEAEARRHAAGAGAAVT